MSAFLSLVTGCAVHSDLEQSVHEGRVKIFRIFKKQILEKMDVIALPKERIEEIVDIKTPSEKITKQELNAIAQKTFLRPANTERYENKTEEARARFGKEATDPDLYNLFKEIGDLGDILPTHAKPDYLLFNGATIQNMRTQLSVANNFIKKGLLKIGKTTQIVFLTGDRDLFAHEDEKAFMNPEKAELNSEWQKPKELPKTEYEAAQFVWNQTLLVPELRTAEIIFINAPKNSVIDSVTGKEKKVRPTTSDTIRTWIHDYQPKPGTCVSIITQPFGRFRKKTMEQEFKKACLDKQGFSAEVAGVDTYKTQEKFYNDIITFLDNLARTLYTECAT